MLNFFEALLEYISMAWDFSLNLITTMISLVTALTGAMLIPNMVMSYIGGIIGASAVAVVGFAILKILVGRTSI